MQRLCWSYKSNGDGLTEDGGERAATEPMTKQGKKRQSCPSVIGRLRMFVRSTSWWKKEGAVTLTRLLPHAGFTDGKVLGLVWVSLWLLTFGVKSVKTLSFQLKFSWAPLHIPISVTGVHWKREKDVFFGFFYSSHASLQVSAIRLLPVLIQILMNAGYPSHVLPCSLELRWMAQHNNENGKTKPPLHHYYPEESLTTPFPHCIRL